MTTELLDPPNDHAGGVIEFLSSIGDFEFSSQEQDRKVVTRKGNITHTRCSVKVLVNFNSKYRVKGVVLPRSRKFPLTPWQIREAEFSLIIDVNSFYSCVKLQFVR